MQTNRTIGATHTLLVDREHVWSALLDPATPARLLPGRGTAEVTTDGVRARVELRDGPVAQDCDVVVSRRVVPGGHRLQVVVSTRGGVGSTETRVDLRLDEHVPGRCELSYAATARAGGLLRLWGRRALAVAAADRAEAVVDRLRTLLPQAPALRAVPATPPVVAAPVVAA